MRRREFYARRRCPRTKIRRKSTFIGQRKDEAPSTWHRLDGGLGFRRDTFDGSDGAARFNSASRRQRRQRRLDRGADQSQCEGQFSAAPVDGAGVGRLEPDQDQPVEIAFAIKDFRYFGAGTPSLSAASNGGASP